MVYVSARLSRQRNILTMMMWLLLLYIYCLLMCATLIFGARSVNSVFVSVTWKSSFNTIVVVCWTNHKKLCIVEEVWVTDREQNDKMTHEGVWEILGSFYPYIIKLIHIYIYVLSVVWWYSWVFWWNKCSCDLCIYWYVGERWRSSTAFLLLAYGTHIYASLLIICKHMHTERVLTIWFGSIMSILKWPVLMKQVRMMSSPL